jgi:DNA-directed RNA polymerase subunit M/transcription elongation factor TFIIS
MNQIYIFFRFLIFSQQCKKKLFFPKMQEEILMKVKQLIQNNQWVCSDIAIHNWCNKLSNQIHDRFQMYEVIHYLTLEQIENCKVVLNPDKDFIANLFKSYDPTIHSVLQDPSVTFQRELKSTQCPKCGKHNTLSCQVQKRAIDEPGRVEYTCYDCKNQWITD